ncbi:MAG: type II secretion system protein GspL, partial [Litorimonas sp.]
MTSNLIIWMETDPAAPWHWNMHDAGQGRAQTESDKAQLAKLGAKAVSVILAGQSVRMLKYDLPKLNNKDRLAAVSFAIEEDIGGSLNVQHIVLGGKDDARVAVITKIEMQKIIDQLNKAGLTDANIYADFDILSSANKIFE